MYSVKGGHLETVQSLLKYKSLRCDYQNKVCASAVNECARLLVCVCLCAGHEGLCACALVVLCYCTCLRCFVCVCLCLFMCACMILCSCICFHVCVCACVCLLL